MSSDPTILRMAAPLMVSFFMRAAFSLVDTMYAAILGDAAVAAIGLTIPFEFLMIAIWVGLSTGLTSALSRALGAREGRSGPGSLGTGRGGGTPGSHRPFASGDGPDVISLNVGGD